MPCKARYHRGYTVESFKWMIYFRNCDLVMPKQFGWISEIAVDEMLVCGQQFPEDRFFEKYWLETLGYLSRRLIVPFRSSYGWRRNPNLGGGFKSENVGVEERLIHLGSHRVAIVSQSNPGVTVFVMGKNGILTGALSTSLSKAQVTFSRDLQKAQIGTRQSTVYSPAVV